jgi:transposase
MHLEVTRSSYKGKVYTSYRIARSVREGGKVQKQVLFPLGNLSSQQARQIHLILRTVSHPDEVLVALQHVVPTRAVCYLEVAVVNYFWDDWRLDLALPESTQSDLTTRQVARILTINRCLDPCSHYRIPKWIRQTALPEMLRLDLRKLNDDKIYYELDKIEDNKAQIERHIQETTKERNPSSYRFVNYDLSSAYFVGIKCKLSRFGKGKDQQPYQRQVVLAILVNAEGYPFKWDVFPGNTPEVHTLEDNIVACRALGVSGVTMVFDRGLVSKANLEILLDGDRGVKFISALDKPQIPKVEGIDLRPFARLPEKTAAERLRSMANFKSFDDKVFYQDLGVRGEMRHVLSVNVELLHVERKLRRQKLRQFRRFLDGFNVELKQAQRDRDAGPTRRAVEAQLRKLKITRFFEDPVLRPIQVTRTLANGDRKPVASFQVKLKKKPDAIAEAKLLDGLCVFITNHVERRGRGYAMPAHNILQAYRDKTEIEDAFKNMKSFLKIRPFFVNTEKHVRAVFTICVLAYHINKTLARRREAIDGKDYLNSYQLYEPFRSCRMVSLKDPETGAKTSKIIPPSKETWTLLNRLGLASLVQNPM